MRPAVQRSAWISLHQIWAPPDQPPPNGDQLVHTRSPNDYLERACLDLAAGLAGTRACNPTVRFLWVCGLSAWGKRCRVQAWQTRAALSNNPSWETTRARRRAPQASGHAWSELPGMPPGSPGSPAAPLAKLARPPRASAYRNPELRGMSQTKLARPHRARRR